MLILNKMKMTTQSRTDNLKPAGSARMGY